MAPYQKDFVAGAYLMIPKSAGTITAGASMQSGVGIEMAAEFAETAMMYC
jgi:hypothetical protein